MARLEDVELVGYLEWLSRDWRQVAGDSVGRRVVAHIDAGEREVAYWLRYSDRLTPSERQRIAQNDFAAIVRPLEPTWKNGDWLKVASNLRIRITTSRWSREAYRYSFDVQDFRANFMRRVPQMFEPPELDDYGVPVPHDAEAIARARLDGSYTQAHALAVPESDETVPDTYQNVLSLQAKQRHAERRNQEQAEAKAREDARRISATIRDTMLMLARNGGDLDGYVAQVARAAQSEMREAA